MLIIDNGLMVMVMKINLTIVHNHSLILRWEFKVACHKFPHVNFALLLMQRSQVDTILTFLHLKVKRSKGFEIKHKQFYNAVAKG